MHLIDKNVLSLLTACSASRRLLLRQTPHLRNPTLLIGDAAMPLVTPVTPATPSPWHAGEKQLQSQTGVAERMEAVGSKVLRDHLPEQHQRFYTQLPCIVVGAVDAHGQPWASVLDDRAGFIASPQPRLLTVSRVPDLDDPISHGFTPGAALGLLGIELHTRRRNRVNGRISQLDQQGFSVAVEQAFGNCPQYIQQRQLNQALPPSQPARPMSTHLSALDDAAVATIRMADTFFVASYADVLDDPEQRQVDVSHRGGLKGFVRVDGDVLTIPDFAGNRFFNTLGNFVLNPRAGLVFVDFASGDLLHLTGRVEVILDSPEIAAFEGAERVWKLQVDAAVRRPAALRSRWTFEAFSPASLNTGTWR